MSDPSTLVLPFSAIRAGDLPRVGGKGANLGELAAAGFPLPPGACVTTAAFERFMAACPEREELYALLETVAPGDLEAARAAGKQVRERLRTVRVPDEVAEAIREAWQALGPDHAYAVRSSATAEDLPGSSFAGQQDSFLNVIGEADLLDAVRRCWISLFTDRAILYRGRNGFAHRDVQLAVVVQRMVMAEKSGILFTADPLTGHRHTASIDASFGLGEALVGGLVTPDSYRVDRRDGRIIERQVAEKQLAILPERGGGTRQEPLPEERRREPVLSDAEILALTGMGSRVEAHFGSPQDIEWAIAGGELYLLQSRPITSLYPIDGLASPDGSLHIYFSSGHQQNMTNPLSPLGLSTLQQFLPGGGGGARSAHPYARASGGRLFMDLTMPLRHPLLRRVVFALTAQFDTLAPDALRIALQRPEFKRAHPPTPSLPLLRNALGMAARLLAALWWRDMTGSVDEVNRRMRRTVEEGTTRLEGLPPGREQLGAMLDIFHSLFGVIAGWVPWFAAGELAKRLVQRVARGWAGPADLEAYSLGLPGNAVTEMNLSLGDLAELARQSPALVAHFDGLGEESGGWLAGAATIPGAAPFLEGWAAFLDEYGARGPSEIDIRTPGWYEEPLPLLQVIASSLRQPPGRHRAQQRAFASARNEAVGNLLVVARRGPLGWLRARLVRRLIHVVHHAGALREHHKLLVVQILRPIKEGLKETARHLTREGKLARPDDLWFLTWPELLAIWDDDGGEIAARLPARRAELARFHTMSPPLIITSDGESPVVKHRVEDAPPGALVGNPVSAGVVVGTVRVIRDPQRETLRPGEILVAPFTDPGWTPLFLNAAGLVLEVGGAMTHGSVVAREYGIPAVVGVRDALERLHTGQRVRLDGNRGLIEPLDGDPTTGATTGD